MAEIVIGIGTSHSPQLSIRAKELTEDKFRERDEACLAGIEVLGDALKAAKPDVVVVFGDDQQEQFHDDNMPMFAIYHGKGLPVVKHNNLRPAAWKDAEEKGWAETAPEYEAASDLADHLIRALTDAEFDITRCNKLRAEIGVGHAFSFLYRRVLPGSKVPMVPVMVNTYYPPNQPTPKRCYAFGQAVRKAIETWDSNKRVAVLASGGLSHVVIDEEIDAMVIDGLKNKKPEVLFQLPRKKLHGGTSEILNWVALAGAMENRDLKYLEYVTTYRSPAATGCGMGFAYWQ